MSAVTLVVIGAAVLAFVVTLTFEVYCSLQYAASLNTARMVARAVEETAKEASIKQSVGKRSPKTPVRAGECASGVWWSLVDTVECVSAKHSGCELPLPLSLSPLGFFSPLCCVQWYVQL